MKTKKKIGAIVVSTVLVLGAAALLLGVRASDGAVKSGKAPAGYDLATVARGKLETVVTSSGTLQPVSTVSVLAQMSGRVEKVNADYNSKVKKGQVLVTLNTDMLALQEKEAQADLNAAQVNYNLASLDYQNNATLAAKGLVSAYDLKTSRTTMEVKKASLDSAQSALKVIQTQMTQYAQIKSPIDGIVLEKNVDVGQSVIEGSSSNATALFTIAEDLSKMEIKAEVDELDIGSIKVGQQARFTVESSPGKTYSGKVATIRLDPETTDNVVSYYVIVAADNADGALLPGMTANIEFIKETKESALLVPNSALRYQPSTLSAAQIQRMQYAAGLGNLPETEKTAALAEYDAAQKSAASAQSGTNAQKTGLSGVLGGGFGAGGPGMRQKKSSTSADAGMTQSQAQGGAGGAASAAAVAQKPLWYLDAQGKLAVRMVGVGSTDGTNTEIVGSDDLEGAKVILREKTGK